MASCVLELLILIAEAIVANFTDSSKLLPLFNSEVSAPAKTSPAPTVFIALT